MSVVPFRKRRRPRIPRLNVGMIGAGMMLGAGAALGFLGGLPGTTSSANATGFSCLSPTHHDGDAIRCSGVGKSMRLYGIDAPEMPGACRPGRRCTPGDPYASRDHLTALTAGRAVTCRQTDADQYGRRVVRCLAGSVDLSCRMVADGFAVERYGRLSCY